MAMEHLSLDEFNERFASDQKCAEALYSARWPEGYRCPICNHVEFYLTSTRRHPLYECKSCRHQTSLIAGTILEGSPTSLIKWFKALYLLSQPEGISAIKLSKAIEVTYKTAWLIAHKIRVAMQASEQSSKLEGDVHVSSFGYGSVLFFNAHQPVMLGASFDEKGDLNQIKLQQPNPDHVRLPDRIVNKWGYQAFLSENVNSKEVRTFPFYAKIHPLLSPFRTKVKNWLNDTFCGIGAKHLHAYLNEYSFRINFRLNSVGSDLISSFHTLLSCCASTARVTFKQLTSPRRTLPVAWRLQGKKGKWISINRRAWSY